MGELLTELSQIEFPILHVMLNVIVIFINTTMKCSLKVPRKLMKVNASKNYLMPFIEHQASLEFLSTIDGNAI